MVWSKVNQDLLAVGYGNCKTPTKPGEALDEARQVGLVLFRSLRYPDYLSGEGAS